MSEDGCLMGCCAMSSGRNWPTFEMFLLPPSPQITTLSHHRLIGTWVQTTVYLRPSVIRKLSVWRDVSVSNSIMVSSVARHLYQIVHSRKQKLAALFSQIARQAVQVSSEFYDFLQLYIFYFCLLTDIKQKKQNSSCQLLLNVRMQYGCFTQCQKRIKSLISFKVSVLLAESVIREIQVNFRCSEIAHLV
jgi:hypothetical protein